MSLQQLRYLLEISKHHSITKTASALFVTQPSISKAIKDLEEELDIVVLERTNKGVVFTQAGHELLFYATMVLDQMDAMSAHFKKNTPMKLVVSSQHFGFAIDALAKWIAYYAKSPYELDIREGKTTNVIDDVATNKSSIGLLSLSALNRTFFERYFSAKELEFIPLATMAQAVFLRQEHPLAHEKTITLEQLVDFPCFTFQQDDMLLHVAEGALDVDNRAQLVYIKDRGTMNNLLANTDGYNVGTGCIVPGYMNPNIISIPLAGGTEIQIGYIQRQHTFLAPEIQHYIKWVNDALQRSIPMH